jgi:hypothetical protein
MCAGPACSRCVDQKLDELPFLGTRRVAMVRCAGAVEQLKTRLNPALYEGL